MLTHLCALVPWQRTTSGEFVGVMQRHAVAISMDGKGCWPDNVFVERLWKTIKYEHVYLHAYETVSEARAKLATYLEFYQSPAAAHGA